jgi:hypothetical protein
MNGPAAKHKRRRVLARSAVTALLLVIVAMGFLRLRRHADMSVIPATYSECRGPVITAHVTWDMRGTAKGHVFVSAYQLGMQPRTFASGPLVGTADTGPWVSDGTTIVLTDDRHRKLGRRTVESTDCAAHQLWVHSI